MVDLNPNVSGISSCRPPYPRKNGVLKIFISIVKYKPKPLYLISDTFKQKFSSISFKYRINYCNINIHSNKIMLKVNLCS